MARVRAAVEDVVFAGRESLVGGSGVPDTARRRGFASPARMSPAVG